MQWMTLFQKEVRENWQNKKWIWVPLVMIILTIMDPLSYYFLPQLIDMVGSVPEGTVLEIPDLQPAEVMMMSLSQLSLFGVMIITLISMGTISGEKKRGITEIILVKPISAVNYVTAKWVAYALLIGLSLFISLLTSWYYVDMLFGGLAFTTFLKITFFYGLWFLFVLTLSFFYNALLKSPGLVIACTITTLFIMSVFNLIFSNILTWFPNNLTGHISEMIIFNEISTELIGTSTILVFLIILLLVASIFLFNKREKVY